LSNARLKIVADAHIWGAESAFSSIPRFDVELELLEQCDISRESLGDADILLTRSSTKVNAALLDGTPVRFAATATIGDDHFDKAWLDTQGIVWANAAGSSTGSVIEYMLTALLELHRRQLISIPDTLLGIVGVGRIGGALAGVCEAMGMKLLLNDPPRQRAGEMGFSPLDELLQQVDVLTLHTPMIRSGTDRTEHLVDAAFLERFQGCGVINAARGGCVDNDALLNWLAEDKQRWTVLDCWEGEPLVSRKLLGHPQVAIATPHIAGHSLDGKAANTQYVYDALCRYLGVEPVWRMEAELPPVVDEYDLSCGEDPWHALHALAVGLYPIMRDDAEMRSWGGLKGKELAESFAGYRRYYPVRRSWSGVTVKMAAIDGLLAKTVQQMGMHVIGSDDGVNE